MKIYSLVLCSDSRRGRFLASVVGALVVSASGCGKTHDPDTGDAGAGDAGIPLKTCEGSTDCSGDTPYCSPDHVCVAACTTDDACTSKTCDLDSGQCLAEDTIVYAAPTGSDTAACTKTDPCSIGHAFAIAVAPRNVIKLFPGTYTYAANLAVGGSITVYGDATWLAPDGSPVVQLAGPSNAGLVLRVIGVSFSSTAADAITTKGVNIELDRVTIDAAATAIEVIGAGGAATLSIKQSSIRSQDNQSSTIVAGPGNATIERTIIDGGGIGITAAASNLFITNSVIANQSDRAFFLTSFAESGLGVAVVSFSTIFNSSVSCIHTTLANSVVLNQSSGAPADTVTSGSACASYSVVFPQTTPLGTGSLLGVDPLLSDPTHGDYHLTADSPAVDTADPAATIDVDLDGTSRPQGARRDMGAFERMK